MNFRILHPLTSGIGPGKRWFIEQYSLFFILANFILLSMSFEKSKKFILRILIFTLALPLYGVSLLEFKTNAFENHFNDLVIVNYPTFNFKKVFSKEMIPRTKFTSFNDFFIYAQGLYGKNLAMLEAGWKIKDSDELKSIYYMNFVSRLWAYGNKENPDSIGCVFNNEQVGKIDSKNLTVEHYVRSEIGCCKDYAEILNFMLDKEGIKNRLVHVKGHLFNEAFFNGKWNVLDANTNILFHDSWMNITFREPGKKFNVSMFPHHNMTKNSQAFRKVIGKFRYEMITSAVKRNVFPTYE